VVIVCLVFGTTYLSHLQGSRVREKKTITTRLHVISQKSADLINIAAEAWNQRQTYSEILNKNVAPTLQLTVFNCIFACTACFVTTADRRQQCVNDMCTFEFCWSYIKKENVLHRAVFGQLSNFWTYSYSHRNEFSFNMRSALFWDITRRRVVIIYQRFGTTYRSHLHGSRVRVGTNTLSRNVGKQLPHDAAWYPRRAQISWTLQPKPEITTVLIYFYLKLKYFFINISSPPLTWLEKKASEAI
jgi:hypothetical protein